MRSHDFARHPLLTAAAQCYNYWKRRRGRRDEEDHYNRGSWVGSVSQFIEKEDSHNKILKNTRLKNGC